jgi:hypothetical protein
MPPTPMILIVPRERRYNARITSVERAPSGAPLNPPAPMAETTRAGVFGKFSRAVVVLVAMMPSIPVRRATSMIISKSPVSRSGATFTSSGTRRASAPSRPARSDNSPLRFCSAASSSASASARCSSRRLGVFGELTLIVM